MTNFENFKNMSIDEMAEWIEETLPTNCNFCVGKNTSECGYREKDELDRTEFCIKNRKLWLESEVEE